MLKRLELSEEVHAELKRHCASRGIIFLSTPYSRSSVDMLERQGVFGYKISSSDTTNISLLDYVARKGKAVLLSTGMCDMEEVRAAFNALRGPGLRQIALLHCTSEYPAPLDESNLRAIKTLGDEFHCPVGFSDHTSGACAAAWAVAAGACIIEKHFTLDRNLPGPDHQASLEPHWVTVRNARCPASSRTSISCKGAWSHGDLSLLLRRSRRKRSLASDPE
jgi:sialic acid synthase SpsE